ncbi:MobP3 family relaxase [uncultured Ruminococcus sp.]|uniref:MobP3 family relaxase n=1 Tax=uncultured Ruminococcus sp. TaxID=165186 RepID=UPI003416557D
MKALYDTALYIYHGGESIAQLIVSSRYLKSGKRGKTKRRNFTKYIATRESVEKRPQNTGKTTANQKQLIAELIKEFPMVKQYLEYTDYTKNPSSENASELISTIIERHADVIGNRRNFVGYMAMRPGAERHGEHGLFNGSDEPIDLNAVANEVAEHPGYVWTHVVSLRREDAVRLGYTNSDMWRELVKRHIDDISKAQNIPLANMKWYAAFHDTTHHPHIHLIVYSADPRQGYLTKEGMAAIRSAFANDIFHEDMKSIYQEQTLTRDELKALSEDQMSEILSQIGSGFVDERLVTKVRELNAQLQSIGGKKVYGYLPKEIKQTVDDIFFLLSQNEDIQKLYDKWCEFEKAKYRMFTQKDKRFPALIDNKEFRSVRNMIIRTVMRMDNAQAVLAEPEFIEIQDDVHIEKTAQSKESVIFPDTATKEITLKRKQAHKYIDSTYEEQDISKGIKTLTELAENGDTMSAYMLGKIYLKGDIVYRNFNKAEKYLRQASVDNEYAMYTLAKLYMTDERKNLSAAIRLLGKACKNKDVRPYAAYAYAKILLDDNEFHDTENAIQLLKENADNNGLCSYLLGKVYLFGNGDVEKNKAEAIRWLTMSAESGNHYAQELMNHSDNNNSTVLANSIVSLLTNLGRIIEDDNSRSRKNISRTDRKLMQAIQRKKRELGIKSEVGDMKFE